MYTMNSYLLILVALCYCSLLASSNTSESPTCARGLVGTSYGKGNQPVKLAQLCSPIDVVSHVEQTRSRKTGEAHVLPLRQQLKPVAREGCSSSIIPIKTLVF
jgi:hypothetical protein